MKEMKLKTLKFKIIQASFGQKEIESNIWLDIRLVAVTLLVLI